MGLGMYDQCLYELYLIADLLFLLLSVLVGTIL